MEICINTILMLFLFLLFFFSALFLFAFFVVINIYWIIARRCRCVWWMPKTIAIIQSINSKRTMFCVNWINVCWHFVRIPRVRWWRAPRHRDWSDAVRPPPAASAAETIIKTPKSNEITMFNDGMGFRGFTVLMILFHRCFCFIFDDLLLDYRRSVKAAVIRPEMRYKSLWNRHRPAPSDPVTIPEPSKMVSGWLATLASSCCSYCFFFLVDCRYRPSSIVVDGEPSRGQQCQSWRCG